MKIHLCADFGLFLSEQILESAKEVSMKLISVPLVSTSFVSDDPLILLSSSANSLFCDAWNTFFLYARQRPW